MKKLWLFVPLLFGFLALGFTAGTVLAQGEDKTGTPPPTSFAARVAAILGLEEAQVRDAFKQAAREMQDEALQKTLDRMVAKGRLSQEQADQIKQWYQSRPDALSPRPHFRGHRFHGSVRGEGYGRHRMGFGHRAGPPHGPVGHRFWAFP